MIHSLPSVLIDGNNTFCNGYIYDLKYKINFGDAPSSVMITLASEDGTYLEPALSANSTYTIQIGTSRRLDYHCVESTEIKSGSNKLLQVEFWDQSITLDQHWVGLHKRQGDAGENGYAVDGKFIYLGIELHPCDSNKDGRVDLLDVPYLSNPCDPCPDCPPGKIGQHCPTLTCTSIFETAYNFNHLVSAIGLLGIPLHSVPVTNNYYMAEYTGTLRQVLQSWGADYGFTFYWSEDNELIFIDLKQAITINESIPRELVGQSSLKQSIKGTETRGICSYYARDGSKTSFSCFKTDYPYLKCLTLKDFYDNDPIDRLGADNAALVNSYEISCSLARYGKAFYDSYEYWRNYGITTAAKAVEAQGTVIARLGIKIIQVVTNGSTATFHDGLQRKLNTDPLNKEETNILYKYLTGRISQNSAGYHSSGLYFVIATWNKTAYESNYSRVLQDTDILGRYFYRKNVQTQFCIEGLNNAVPSVEGPGGENGSYIKRGMPIQKIFYNKITPHQNSVVDDLFNDAIPPTTISDIIMLERTPYWYPSVQSHTDPTVTFAANNDQGYLHTLFKAWEDLSLVHMSHFVVADIVGETLVAPFINDPNLAVFRCVPAPKTDPNDIFTFVVKQHPRERSMVPIVGNTNNGTCWQETEIRYWGLTDKKCIRIDLADYRLGISRASIFTPAKAFDAVCESDSYIAQIKQEYSQDVIIPKHQSSRFDVGVGTSNTLSTSVNTRNIDSSDISIFFGGCIVNNSVLQEIHQRFNVGLNYDNTEVRRESSLTIYGIDVPVVPTVADGLVSMDISFSSRGVQTSFVLANKPAAKVSLDVARRIVEQERRPPTNI